MFVVALKGAAGAPRGACVFVWHEKHNLFENVHSSPAPGPLWPNREADRTLITTVRCVVRRGRESGHGSPKAGHLGLPDVPGEAQEPPRERETRRTAWIFEKLQKTSFLIMYTTLECQARFGQQGPPTERQSLRDDVFCAVPLKVARGSQKGGRAYQVFV